MKPRVLKTYKILAVALTATAGCATTTTVSPEPSGNETAVAVVPPAETAPSANVAAADTPAPLPTAQAAIVQAPAPAKVDAPRPESKDPALLALRDDLESWERGKIQANVAKFRPLCDKDGYPLVGNTARKGPPIGYEPSKFCAQVRGGSLK